MKFPVRTEVARHLRRRPKHVPKLQAQTVPVDEVPTCEVQVLTDDISTSLFLTESATARPELAPEVAIAILDLPNESKLVRE